LGTATYRLFEVLAAGRVPVILSDDWVPPKGPDWDSFSIRWPEARIPELPAELERRQAEAPVMGIRARQAFDEWFALDISLTRQMSELASLLDRSPPREFPSSGFRDAQFLRAARAEVTGSARSALARSRLAKSAYRAVRSRRIRSGVRS
ncbi:MAG TPA: exostosin family protein, partial [Acidimicrobiales bacterium]|nr:exostosin family protein [Acidimicrobiales bacterium]